MCGSVPKGEEEVFIADRCSGIPALSVRRTNHIGDIVIPEFYYPGALQALDFRQDVFANGGRQHGDFEGRAVT